MNQGDYSTKFRGEAGTCAPPPKKTCAHASPGHVRADMKMADISLEKLSHDEKLHLLERLLNDLHHAGVLSSHSLMAVASDVMHLDYREDADLLCFAEIFSENEEE